MLRADDIAKIFGTQENFSMIKTLLSSQQSFNPGSKPTAGSKTASSIPPLASRSNANASSSTPMDIKVEQAMMDLQDMKIKMVDTQPLLQEPRFRLSAYTNMNTTTSDMIGMP